MRAGDGPEGEDEGHQRPAGRPITVAAKATHRAIAPRRPLAVESSEARGSGAGRADGSIFRSYPCRASDRASDVQIKRSHPGQAGARRPAPGVWTKMRKGLRHLRQAAWVIGCAPGRFRADQVRGACAP